MVQKGPCVRKWVNTFLDNLEGLLYLAHQHELFLSPRKFILYRRNLKWCGKIISGNGVSHDPKRIATLTSIQLPTTAGELEQFLSAVNWMRDRLVDYARIVDSLQIILDAALAGGKRTKRAAVAIATELTPADRRAFDETKRLLTSAATLATPDDEASTCLFTDASDGGWVTRSDAGLWNDERRPIHEQQHRLLIGMDESFRDAQLNWTVIEKEAYPIVLACEKTTSFSDHKAFYCDHRNLIHVFAPERGVKKQVRGNLLRWPLKIMGYRYIIEHIEGSRNLWADMVSRWAGTQPVEVRVKRFTVRKLVRCHAAPTAPQVVLRPLDDDGFLWPSLAYIKLALRGAQAPDDTTAGAEAILRRGDRIWIPASSHELLQRLLVIAYCGARVWVSDDGTHFKNEMVAELSRRPKSHQQFALVYTPWTNGSAERVNRDIIQVLRAMILDYRLSYKDWVDLVPMVQSSLNHTPVTSLGNKTPVGLFTGLECPTPLREYYNASTKTLQKLPAGPAKIDSFLAELRASVRAMHKPVEVAKLKQRLLNRKRKRGENVVNFDVGDYVLRSRVDEKYGNKLQVTWTGPHKVVRADSHSFCVQHLVTGEEHDVHASRLMFYSDSSLNVTEEILDHIASQGIVLAISTIKKHRRNTTGPEAHETCLEPLRLLLV